MKPNEIISDDDIERVHGHANFGTNITKREVVDYTVLKYACGFQSGHTAWQIIFEHGLLRKDNQLTVKGKKYLWAVFGKVSL